MNAQLIPAGTELPTTPELARANAMANESRTIALSIVVDSQPMFEIAGDELRSISTRRKEMEELRKSLTRPLDESKSRIMAMFRGPDEIMANAENALRRAMLEFQQAEQKKANDALRVAAEAKRKERDELLAKQTEAEKTGDADVAAAATQALDLADVAPIASLAVAVPKAAGIATRSTFKYEVTSLKELVIAAGKAAEGGDDTLLGYLKASDAIGGVVRSLKEKTRIPGVRVYEDKGLSVRRA